MPPLWKPQNGFHSGLEISHRTRDSHISTADHRHDRIEERRTGQSRRNQARSARRQTRGTLGGKVLKTRGPLLLKTDMVQTPFQAPNANAHAERFVRSIKSECLDRLILLGERHLRQTIREFMAHYHRERNHQGVRNELIEPSPTVETSDCRIRRRPRLGGLLNYYARAA